MLYMLAMLLPKTSRDAIDSGHWAFLWTRDDNSTNAMDQIASSLGIQVLEDQNHCLLMKFVHKLLGADILPCKLWLLRQGGH